MKALKITCSTATWCIINNVSLDSLTTSAHRGGWLVITTMYLGIYVYFLS